MLARLKETNPEPAAKGLFAMKFMQRAEEKRRQEFEKAAKEFEEEKDVELLRFKSVSSVVCCVEFASAGDCGVRLHAQICGTF